MSERTTDREDDNNQGSEPEDRDPVGSSDQAKKREREMEDSGQENAG